VSNQPEHNPRHPRHLVGDKQVGEADAHPPKWNGGVQDATQENPRYRRVNGESMWGASLKSLPQGAKAEEAQQEEGDSANCLQEEPHRRLLEDGSQA